MWGTITQTKWMERTFRFDFPAGVFPNVVERLRGTPARLEELVAGLSDETLRRRPEGKWSILQQIGHLLVLDELHEGRLEDYLAARKELRPADPSNRATEDGGYNEMSVSELLSSFRERRMRFVKRMEDLDASAVARRAVHPRLRIEMRLVDMAYFVAEHDDHHLAAITRLKRTS